MKKRRVLTGIASVIGLLLIIIGIVKKAGSATAAFTVIGGADGPTSIFLAGKVGDEFYTGVIVAGIIVLLAVVLFLFKISRK